MNRILALAVSAIFVVSCDVQQNDAQPPAQSALGEATILTGRAAYDEYCASCHDSGLDGAPRTATAADWLGRSQLWQAVLLEHAKEGYLEMPGRGGRSELADRSVDSAAEYMLAITYPDRRPD